MDSVGSLLDLAGEQEYAQATVEYLKARQVFLQARGRLVAAVERVGHDRDHLLEREKKEGIIPLEDVRRVVPHLGPLRHRVPLPATFLQVKEYMDWTTAQAGEWLSRQQKAGYVEHRGPKRAYIYYYTDKYHQRVREHAASLRGKLADGDSSSSSINELSSE